MGKQRLEFNIRFDQKEWDVLRKLKEKHAINISAAVKIFLRKKLEQLEKYGDKS
jgi:hypothetical protein